MTDREQPQLIPLQNRADDRGILRVGEFDLTMPFMVARFFTVTGVPPGSWRGNHAHRTCHQFLVCTSGRIPVRTTSPTGIHETFVLTPASGGLHIPPLVWSSQQYSSTESQLMVLASEPYSADEYIMNPDEFLAITGAHADEFHI